MAVMVVFMRGKGLEEIGYENTGPCSKERGAGEGKPEKAPNTNLQAPGKH
jgi:hypothetical protein